RRIEHDELEGLVGTGLPAEVPADVAAVEADAVGETVPDRMLGAPLERARRPVDRDDLAGAAPRGREREAPREAEEVQDAPAARDRLDESAVLALVEVEAGLLPAD